jgi:hypothetical protein
LTPEQTTLLEKLYVFSYYKPNISEITRQLGNDVSVQSVQYYIKQYNLENRRKHNIEKNENSDNNLLNNSIVCNQKQLQSIDIIHTEISTKQSINSGLKILSNKAKKMLLSLDINPILLESLARSYKTLSEAYNILYGKNISLKSKNTLVVSGNSNNNNNNTQINNIDSKTYNDLDNNMTIIKDRMKQIEKQENLK